MNLYPTRLLKQYWIEILALVLFTGLIATPLESQSLESIWTAFHLAEDRYDPKEKSYSFFNSVSRPRTFNRETIAYRMHSFCHDYYQFHTKEKISWFRPQIEKLIWEYYLPQVRNLQYNKPIFTCQPSPLNLNQKTLITFQIDYSLGFFPILWEKQIQGSTNEIVEALTNRDGRPDSFTKFHPYMENCIVDKKRDTNFSGNIDQWFIYKNCKLIRVEEDYDEDGYKERICNYDGEERLISCQGLGTKTMKLAEKYKQLNPKKYIYYLKKANQEYMNKFGNTPRHVCGNLLDIIKTEFDLGNYQNVTENFVQINQNPNCKKQDLDAQVYSAFTSLYKLKRFSEAANKYESANQEYRREYGMDSIDMVLNTAFAYLSSNQPKKCLNSLQSIKNRSINKEGSYLFHYYTGSCLLLERNYKKAFHSLKRSQAFSEDPIDLGQTYLKLGILFDQLKDGKLESESYFRKSIEFNPKNEKTVKEYKKRKTFLAE